MSQLTAGIAMGTMAALLIFMAATTNSAFAQQANPQGAPNPKAIQQQNLNRQLFTTGTAKIGNVTLRLAGGVLITLRLAGGVLVTPLTCINVSGNLSGIPLLGGLNQSLLTQANQALKQHPPNVCFSKSDAMRIRAEVMHQPGPMGTMGGR